MVKRVEYIDAVAGVMILYMIFGHVSIISFQTGFKFDFLFFFMPWFYYKSGAIGKFSSLSTNALLLKGWRKLFPAFILSGILGQIVLWICLFVENSFSFRDFVYLPFRTLILSGGVPGNPPLWFIPSFMIAQIIALAIEQKLEIKHGLIFLLALSGGLSQIQSCYFPAYLASGIYGAFFFLSGRILYPFEGNKWGIIASSFVLAILYMLFGLPKFELRTISNCRCSISAVLIWTIMSTCGCFLVDSIFFLLQHLLKMRFLCYIGKYAMQFYVIHWIILILTVRLISYDLLKISNDTVIFCIGSASIFSLIPLYILIKNEWKKKKYAD